MSASASGQSTNPENAKTTDSQNSDATTGKGPVQARQIDRAHEVPQPSKHGMSGRVMGVQILATGAAAPDRIVTNEELTEFGYDPEWIVQRTGIHERRRAPRTCSTSEMALPAVKKCLNRAQVAAEDLDLIVFATMTPDFPTPATACNLQRAIGAVCPAMDLNAACAGFMYAMVTAAQFIKADPSCKILVVGADMMTRLVHPKNEKTFPLFGDGAGAALLGSGSDEQGIMSFFIGAQGDGGHFLRVPSPGTAIPLTAENIDSGHQYVEMDGRAVFKWAVRMVADASRRAIEDAGLTVDQIDFAILHQANIRIIDSAVENLGLDRSKVLVNVDRYGNTSAASIPLALDQAHQMGQIKSGDRVLMVGFGAGLSWGASVFQW